MTQYNNLKVKLSNLLLNKLKSAIQHETKVVLTLSSNIIGNSDNEIDFPHELSNWKNLINRWLKVSWFH